MEYKEIVNILAPCGLDCTRCLGYADGEVREHAVELSELLKGFESHAERVSNFVPVFKNYLAFKELLDLLSCVDCTGCRGNEQKRKLCGIARCFKDKEFDFCFQCDDYPCEPEGLDDYLKEKWIEMNDRMKEIGVEAFYEETRNEPRYK